MRSTLERCLDSLEGLSVGDAFGEQFFRDPTYVEGLIDRREEPVGTWRWTDDTAMALGIVNVLQRHGSIDQDQLAATFGSDYRDDPQRGYGPAMHRLLTRYTDRGEWVWRASELFDGQGSYGNGAAMRVAPLGAYYADDPVQVATQAERSARVTHTHAEGIAGAVAVALAAMLACSEPNLVGADLLDAVWQNTPNGGVRNGIRKARDLSAGASVVTAAYVLGAGHEVSAQDTVPFCLWCASRTLGDFEEAMWLTVRGLGDRDTTCAIVGGIVAARLGREAIPARWLAAREQLPPWVVALRPGIGT